MHQVVVLVLLFLIGIASAALAQRKGRDPYIWFAIGTILGLLGFILLLALPEKNSGQPAEKLPKQVPSVTIEALPDTVHPHHEFLVKDWYYADAKGKQQGPVSFDALRALWAKKEIGDFTFIWSEGMQEWKKIQDLPEFLQHLSK
jgi:hypothetical protein